MSSESAQRQIDLRALEKAQHAETLIVTHMDNYRRDSELAHAERAETRREILAGFERVDSSISKVHVRVDQLGARWIAVASTVILLLLGLCGYLFIKAMGWN